MATEGPYAAYITAITGFESTLSDAQAELDRAKREIRRNSTSAEKRETEKLTRFDSSVQGYEKSYADVSQLLARPENAPLGANIPQRIRPADAKRDFRTLVQEQRRIVESIKSDVDEFHKFQEQQKVQAAMRAREAKRAAEALAVRRAALSQKPAELEPKEKKSNTNIAVVGGVALLVLVVLFVIMM